MKFPEKVKEAEQIFETYFKKGFLGAVGVNGINVSEVYRQIEYPGGLGGFHRNVWGKWLRRKEAEINKEENYNG